MIERFAESARLVIFRARESALADCETSIQPRHVLLALVDLHSELFEPLLNVRDIQKLRDHLEPQPKPSSPTLDVGQLPLAEDSKRVLRNAASEARFCWRRTAHLRRHIGQAGLEADLRYWQSRTGQAFSLPDLPRRLVRFLLRRRWEVEPQHLLLSLLREADSPAVKFLTDRRVTLEGLRERLCAGMGEQ